jgi:hypothetical protein
MIHSDIKHLFEQFGQTGDTYEEVVRDEEAQAALGRWSLLRSLDLSVGERPARRGGETRRADPVPEVESGPRRTPAAPSRFSPVQNVVPSTSASEHRTADVAQTVKPRPAPDRGGKSGLRATLGRLKHLHETETSGAVSSAPSAEHGSAPQDVAAARPLNQVFSRLARSDTPVRPGFKWRGGS